MRDEKLLAVLKSLKPLLPLPPGHRSSPPPEFLVAMDYIKEFHPTFLSRFYETDDFLIEHDYALELYKKATGRYPARGYQTHRTSWSACIYLTEMLYHSEITKKKGKKK